MYADLQRGERKTWEKLARSRSSLAFIQVHIIILHKVCAFVCCTNSSLCKFSLTRVRLQRYTRQIFVLVLATYLRWRDPKQTTMLSRAPLTQISPVSFPSSTVRTWAGRDVHKPCNSSWKVGARYAHAIIAAGTHFSLEINRGIIYTLWRRFFCMCAFFFSFLSFFVLFF